jgi:hypothetical protein
MILETDEKYSRGRRYAPGPLCHTHLNWLSRRSFGAGLNDTRSRDRLLLTPPMKGSTGNARYRQTPFCSVH